MRKQLFITVLVVAISNVFASTAPPNKIIINLEQSSISWIGKKVAGKHAGTLTFQEGYLEMNETSITGGEFIVDMTSLQVTDLVIGKGKEKLEKYLNSTSFFDVAAYPTATFKITKVTSNNNTSYNIAGELTIKGHTETTQIVLTKAGNTFTTSFKVDRTKYGIVYNSGSVFDGLKNKAINNEFELTISLRI